ncbi:MAG TPA: translation elongation factor Ts [Longimicrobiales bacterium]|nr:translation elongation factor Ts [Longimicrobiales bacterium]
MATITAGMVKELRERTGAGMMECKKALQESNGDMEAAIDVLRARGAAKAAKRSEREASEGVIGTYLHTNNKVAVMVEVNCETDFVARNDALIQLGRDLAMHIAAMSPVAVDESDVPAELIERERGVYREQVKNEGKPEAMWDKIVDGKMKRFFKDSTLMEQVFVKDPEGKQTIRELVQDVAAKTGENVVVRRFVRYQLGE